MIQVNDDNQQRFSAFCKPDTTLNTSDALSPGPKYNLRSYKGKCVVL